MYDELVKSLRDHTHALDCEFCDRACCYPDGKGKGKCVIIQAADAIEFLQTYKTCFDNIVSMGGWWLVGQDKNLYRMNVPMNWPPKGTKTVELFSLPEPPKEET